MCGTKLLNGSIGGSLFMNCQFWFWTKEKCSAAVQFTLLAKLSYLSSYEYVSDNGMSVICRVAIWMKKGNGFVSKKSNMVKNCMNQKICKCDNRDPVLFANIIMSQSSWRKGKGIVLLKYFCEICLLALCATTHRGGRYFPLSSCIHGITLGVVRLFLALFVC